jgi:ribulose-phosphate 3-epimerase
VTSSIVRLEPREQPLAPCNLSDLEKITAATQLRKSRGLNYHIEVDGGIDATTAARCYTAGANVMVAGSSTFRAPDMAAAIRNIRNA